MKPAAIKPYFFVFVQFACIVLIMFSGPLLSSHPLLLALQGLGLAMGLWAFFAMGLDNLHTLPTVGRDTRLVTCGPYRWIRHPMYASVLLVFLPLLVDRYSWLRLGAGVILVIDLLLKLRYEENLLHKRFPAYAGYTEKTKRLIPFLF